MIFPCDCEIHHGRFLSACFLLFSCVKFVWISFICSLLTVDIVFTIFYVFLNPSRLHYILFSSNRCASLYFSTTTTITKGFGFSVIVYCLSSAPAISGCKTNLHFQNSAYILCYVGLSFFFPLPHHDLSKR
jgi:hypothetical protein